MADEPDAAAAPNPAGSGPAAGPDKQPGKQRSQGPVGRVFGRAGAFMGKVPGWFKGVSAVIAFVLLLNQQLAQVPGALHQLPGSLAAIATSFHHTRHPGSHVVFVSNDELLRQSYLNELAGFVTKTDGIDTNQIDSLPQLNPDLVIFGSGAREPQAPVLSETVLNFLDGDVKVMGMGSLGALVLQQIQPFSPLTFSHSIGIGTSEVQLDSQVDQRIRAGLPSDPFKLYLDDPQGGTPGLAVFDASLPLVGATGIVQVGDAAGCRARSWPVARQGDDLFWGYAIPATAMTLDGLRLFRNTVLTLLSDDFQKPLAQAHYKLPGSYPGDALGCLFSTNEYRLAVSSVGAITVAITSTKGLVLDISGPRPDDSFHAEGISPRLVVPVTPQSLAAGQDWLVKVSYTGPMNSRTRIDYDLDLQYPSQVIQEAQALLALALLALTVVFGILSIVYLARTRHPLRPGLDRMWDAVRTKLTRRA